MLQTTGPCQVLVAFGANLGDPIATLRRVIPILRLAIGEISAISSVYLTKALTLNNEPQPDYVNAVLRLQSSLEPQTILGELLKIESELGRDRRADKRWAPRIIDLDLLMVDSIVVDSPELKLPHPGIESRDFVLSPLVEVAADLVHPILAKSIRQLADEFAASGGERFIVRKLPFAI